MASKNIISIENPIFSYRYGRYLSKGSLVIAGTLFVAGIYLLLVNINTDTLIAALGFIMLFIAINAFIPVELFQVNFKTKEYRNCIKYFFFQKGEWKPLRGVQYLSIVQKNKSIYLPGPGIMAGAEDHNFQDTNLRFFIKSGYYIDIEDFEEKLDAIEIGRDIAKGLDLKFIDATIKPPKFIE